MTQPHRILILWLDASGRAAIPKTDGGYRNCEVCSTAFYRSAYDLRTRPSRWCSRECADIGRKRGESRACKACGKSFYVFPSKSERPNDFCSMACYSGENRAARLRGVHTGKKRTPEQRERLKQRNHIPAMEILRTCARCGKEYRRTGHTRHSGLRFCSSACWYDHLRLHPEEHPTFKGGAYPHYGPNWPQQARLARARDGHTCQRCGAQGTKLDVHHIKPRRQFAGDFVTANDLANLITLCRSCHRAVENNPNLLRTRI